MNFYLCPTSLIMPVYLRKKIGTSAELGVWKISETPEMLFQKVLLNDAEQQQYENFKNDTRRMHWLSYRAMLKELISPKEYSHVIYDKFGKPYLQSDSHFLSVSHSGKFSAAIISHDFPVGIDIEILHPRIEKIVHKFLTDKEQQSIGDAFRIEKLYVCWGAKESLYKLYGEKGLLFQEEMFLHPFEYKICGTLSGEIRADGLHKKFNLHYEKLDDYILVYTIADS